MSIYSERTPYEKGKVLILDGNQRSALAATRSLGSKGIPVIVADERVPNLSSSSKYCVDSFSYPPPNTSPDDFVNVIIRQCKERRIEILFPMTEITTELILKHRETLRPVKLPFADSMAFNELTDKWKLHRRATRLGIPYPKTWFIKPDDDLSIIKDEITFPVVLKPYRSRIFYDGKLLPATVDYASSWKDLVQLWDQFPFLEHKFLLQEKVKGAGKGIFALYNSGRAVTFFAHKRIREKPPSGGVSVLRESVPVDPLLCDLSKRLLDNVNWHGVAMVEFKVSVDGIPYLMEVNARFWGSLQLAIDAGVDFPYLLYLLACNEKLEDGREYKVGIRTRWLLGDLDHFYLRLKKESYASDWGFKNFLGYLIDFFRSFNKKTHLEVCKITDLKPFLYEVVEYFGLRWR